MNNITLTLLFIFMIGLVTSCIGQTFEKTQVAEIYRTISSGTTYIVNNGKYLRPNVYFNNLSIKSPSGSRVSYTIGYFDVNGVREEFTRVDTGMNGVYPIGSRPLSGINIRCNSPSCVISGTIVFYRVYIDSSLPKPMESRFPYDYSMGDTQVAFGFKTEPGMCVNIDAANREVSGKMDVQWTINFPENARIEYEIEIQTTMETFQAKYNNADSKVISFQARVIQGATMKSFKICHLSNASEDKPIPVAYFNGEIVYSKYQSSDAASLTPRITFSALMSLFVFISFLLM